ncbi:MAG: DinB-like domain protein [Acidobacteria bacterium]|nr:DinB-like domain protein [Acidobacteriota bacterium]
MHPRTQEVIEYLDTTRSDLSSAVAGVSSDRRDERPAPERWSVAEVLEHLAIIEGRVTQLISGKLAAAKAAGLGNETETSPVLDTIDRARILDRSRRATAPDMVKPRSEQDAAAAWLALQQNRAELRATVLANDGLALGEVTHEHPVLGMINLYQWLIFVGAHEARHTAQIREIAGGWS